jgi:hypothetical protein
MTSDNNFLYNAGIEYLKLVYDEWRIEYYFEWRIEKRDIIFDKGFIYIVGIEDTCDYLDGCKAPYWRIEKRDAISGDYIKEFGKNGFISKVPKINYLEWKNE